MAIPSLLPSGYLSTSGAQFIDQYNNFVRIASVGWQGGDAAGNPMNGTDGSYASILQNAQLIVSYGFNCVRVSWCNATFSDPFVVQQYQYVVQACAAVGLKIVFDHHSDEGGIPQQSNGLWFDVGPGTDGSDGNGRTGTVSAARFQSDWVAFARRWVGSDTVIGYDLHNEPNTGNVSQAIPINWGGVNGDGSTTTAGNACDIRNMHITVGNAIQAVDANKLIICEAPMNYSRSFASGAYNAPEGDLTLAKSNPVVLNVANKVVYSVHIYPNYVGAVSPDSGSAVWTRWTNTWGYLVAQNIAPVWIGEMGASLDGSETLYGGSIAASQTWANSLVAYLNGTTGHLTFTGSQQAVSTDWWCWGDNGNQQLSGAISGDGVTPSPGQYAIYSQLAYFPKSAVTPPAPPPVFTESPQGMIGSLASGPIINTLGEQFTVTGRGLVAVNGVPDSSTANVTVLYYSSHRVYYTDTANRWFVKTVAADAWQQTTDPTASATPTPSPSGKPRVSAPLTGTITPGTWVAGDLVNAAFTSATGTQFHYNYLLPANYNAGVLYPILVWEHTTFDNGYYNATNADPLGLVYNDPQFGQDADHYFNNTWFRTAYPCIVVVPYCHQFYGAAAGNDAVENFGGWTPPGDHGPNEDAVAALAQYFLANFSADASRVYATGDSLGGIGTWALALDYNAVNGAFGQLFTAFAPYAGVIERYGFGVPPPAGVVTALKNVPIFAVHGAQDGTSDPFWDYYFWQQYAGNGNFPASPGAQAGASAYRLLVDPGLGHDVWGNYRQPPSATPIYDWMFAQLSGGSVATPPVPPPVTPPPSPPPVSPPTGLRKWYENPGQDASFWVQPFQTTASWIISGSVLTLLRNGSFGTPTGYVHYNVASDYVVPWVIGRATDPLVPVSDGTITLYVRIPVGTVTEQPPNLTTDSSIGGADSTQPYLVWSATGAVINTGAIRASGSSISVANSLQVDNGAGLLMTDQVTNQPGSNNAIGTIQDFELQYAVNDPAYVIQHMLAYSLDPTQVNTSLIWPLKIADTSFSDTGSVPQGYTIGIPANVPRPAGQTRGFYLLWDNLQQFGWFFYNVASNGCLSIGCYANPANAATSALALDVANSLTAIMSNVCILSNQTGLSSLKGYAAGGKNAFPAPPLLDLSPTGGVQPLPSSFGAYYPSGYNQVPPVPSYPVPPVAPPPPPVVPPTPPPTGTESADGTTVSSARSGRITDTAGNVWRMLGSGVTNDQAPFFVARNSIRDTATAGTLQLYYHLHTVYYQTTSSWFAYNTASNVWVVASNPISATPPPPVPPASANPYTNYGVPINATWEVVTGLLPNTSYDFEVEALNSYGQSQWSNAITVITGSDAVARGLATHLMSARVSMANISSAIAPVLLGFGTFTSVAGLSNSYATNSGAALASMSFTASSTGYQGKVKNIHSGLPAWTANATHNLGDRVSSSGAAWQCTTAGTGGLTAPNGVFSSYPDGTAVWRWLSLIDFTSLNAWASSATAIPATLTMPSVGLVWNNGTINASAGTELLTLTGHTTTPTNNITLRCAPGESFRDAVAGGQPLAFNVTRGVSITLPNATGNINYLHVYDDNVVIDGLQIIDTNTARTSNCTHIGGETGHLTISNCLLDGYGQSGGAVIAGTNGGVLTAQNCVFVDRQAVADNGTAVSTPANGSALVGCTFVSTNNNASGFAVTSAATSFQITNTIFVGYSDSIDGSGTMQVDHCLFSASNAGSTPGALSLGAGNLYSRTATNQFVNAATDFRLKAGADAVDRGTASGLTQDIAFRARPRGPAYDIGAYEF